MEEHGTLIPLFYSAGIPGELGDIPLLGMSGSPKHLPW